MFAVFAFNYTCIIEATAWMELRLLLFVFFITSTTFSWDDFCVFMFGVKLFSDMQNIAHYLQSDHFIYGTIRLARIIVSISKEINIMFMFYSP